ncbi:MAG: TRAP transporter small permease subunit [Bacillota bacterium]|nr:TRAP transporter small permease subunit [Bacillota bacterium]
MRKRIKKINYYLQFISCVTLLALMFMTGADVIMRSFLNRPMSGSYELTSIFLTFIVFFGVGNAQHFKEHVVIDALYDRLPRKGQRFISYLSSVIYLAITILMCWVVFKYSQLLVSTNANTAILKIPHWPVVLIAAVGLIGYVLSVVADLLFLKEGGVLGNDVD